MLCTDFGGGGAAGLLFLAVFRLLIAVASLVAEHRLKAHGLPQLQLPSLRDCGSWALEH